MVRTSGDPVTGAHLPRHVRPGLCLSTDSMLATRIPTWSSIPCWARGYYLALQSSDSSEELGILHSVAILSSASSRSIWSWLFWLDVSVLGNNNERLLFLKGTYQRSLREWKEPGIPVPWSVEREYELRDFPDIMYGRDHRGNSLFSVL